MEVMIDSRLVKAHRQKKSWSQDQLATISGLSLRTIQRIEKEGACSFESMQALASAFEIDVSSLQIDDKEREHISHLRRVRLFSFLANTLGILCAFSAITYSLINGNMSGGEAGLYYGGVALLGGLGYVGLALLCEYFRKNKVSYW